MKLVNIASLDPAIRASGRTGLENASAADRAMWAEMEADWERFAIKSNEVMDRFGVTTQSEALGTGPGSIDELVDFTGVDKTMLAKVRIGQAFFRRAVLSAYDYKCCITGLAVPSLLVASHILPWHADTTNRLNPRNGLCLSALHDRSFDAGILTIGEDMTVRVSKDAGNDADSFFRLALMAYEGKPIALPERFQPEGEFLNYHREKIFRG